jgi:periplasmic protein CpxP/Spy
MRLLPAETAIAASTPASPMFMAPRAPTLKRFMQVAACSAVLALGRQACAETAAEGGMHCTPPMAAFAAPAFGGPMMPVSAPPFAAGRPMPGGMPPPDGQMPPFLHGLALTEAQDDQIFAIVHAAAPMLREQGKLARKNAELVRAMTDSGNYDETKLKALADAVARASMEIMILHARSAHQIFAVLSPEQRAQAEAFKAKFEAGRECGPQPKQ